MIEIWASDDEHTSDFCHFSWAPRHHQVGKPADTAFDAIIEICALSAANRLETFKVLYSIFRYKYYDDEVGYRQSHARRQEASFGSYGARHYEEIKAISTKLTAIYIAARNRHGHQAQ